MRKRVHKRRGSQAGVRLSELRISNRLLFCSGLTAVVAAMIFGGAPTQQGWQFAVIFLTGLWTLCVAIAQGALGDFWRLPWSIRLFVILSILLVLAQLIPMPPGLWQSLPGRALERDILIAIGLPGRWMPLSMEPLNTALAALMIVPLLGIFLTVLRLSGDEQQWLALAILVAISLALCLGVLQVASDGRLMSFYRTAHQGSLLGFFANRNHMADLLALAICLGVFFVIRFGWRGPQALVAIGIIGILAMGSILGTASRTGLVLGLVGLLLSVAVFVEGGKRNMRNIALASGGTLIAGLTALSYSGVASKVLDRYEAVGTDLRWDIWTRSTGIIADVFPLGAGFGAYPNLYKTYEQIDWIIPVYINHAHNDYIEIAVEAGIAGIGLIVAFLWIWARSTVGAWRVQRRSIRQTALLGSIGILLLLLHSILDYPLRTAALAALFSVFLGWLVRPRVVPRNLIVA